MRVDSTGLRWFAAAALSAFGCGDDANGADAGPDGTALVDGGATVAEIPWLAAGAPDIAAPVLTPCPSGWTEVTSADGIATCEPFGSAGPDTCAEGEAHFVGGAGCERLGPACPADGLPDGLPADQPAVFVLDGAAGGDGSRASPYGSPSSFAWGSLPGDTIVALGVGTYDAVVRLPARVSLWGACVERTHVHSTMAALRDGVINVVRGASGLRRLTVAAGPRPGIWAFGAGDLDLSDVVVQGATQQGAFVAAGAQLRAERFVVRDTQQATAGVLGHGLGAQIGGSIEVDRAIFERNNELGVSGQESGTSVVLRDVAIRDTAAPTGVLGIGVGLQLGATGQLERLLVEGTVDGGVACTDGECSLDVSDAVLRGSTGGLVGDLGHGFTADVGAAGRGSRLLMEDNGAGGIFTDEGATSTFTDVVVRDNPGRERDGLYGLGVVVQDGAVTELARAHFENTRHIGVFSGGAGANAILADVVIRDTQPVVATDTDGRGIDVQRGGRVEATRVLVERSYDLGILVRDREPDSSFSLEDVAVRDTQPVSENGIRGRGIQLQYGSGSMLRVLVENSHQLGVIAIENARLDLADVVIRGTVANRCGAPECMVAPMGTALAAYGASAVSIERFEIADAELCGVHVGSASGLDLVDGDIGGCAIGACVQVPGYDTNRLTTRVRYSANAVNLEATELPVPDPSLPDPVLP